MRVIMMAGLLVFLCACASDPISRNELALMGDTSLVYVDMPANLSAYATNNVDKMVTAGLFLFVSMASAPGMYLLDKHLEHKAEATIQARDTVIKRLPFSTELQARSQAVIQDSPWASRLPFAFHDYMDEDPESALQELERTGKNSVIILWPGVFLEDSGQHLLVSMHIAIYVRGRQGDTGRPIAVKYKSRDFTYSYPIRMLSKPTSWAEQKQDAELLAGVSLEDSLHYWLGDDGALVREDFADALPKIVADMRNCFGASAG